MNTTPVPARGLRPLAAIASVSSALLASVGAEDSEKPYYDLKLGTGVDYSTGDYGTSSSTDIWYVPLTAKLEAPSHAFKLTVPFLSITDSGGVVGGGDQVIVVGDGGGGSENTESGLGDVIGSFTYYLYGGNDVLPMVDVTYKAKFPTADEDKGLGTGKYDSSVEIDLTKAWGGTTVFSTVGHKWFGDPDGVDLKDVFYASLGFQQNVSAAARVGLIYDVREKTTDNSEGISELTAFLGTDLGEKWKFMLYGVAGFSDGSPDWGVGVTLSRNGIISDLLRMR